MKQNELDQKLVPVELENHIPAVALRLFKRILQGNFKKVALLGFSENMRWLFRLLSGKGMGPVLCDWRPAYEAYDCGGKQLVAADTLENGKETLVVICVEEIHMMKEAMWYLYKNKPAVPAIYDRDLIHDPFHQEEPFKSIRERARMRAVSMISEQQLFDLVQFIRATSHVAGDVVEFGSLYGGSGAVLVEAVRHYGIKPVWLFDSFTGIPDSRYGLDYHWNGSFCDSSYAAVRDAFADCENVKIIRGNICDTHTQLTKSVSFGYIASDTLESGELLLNFLWPRLNPMGIIAVCDYGSYPNAIPLTMYTDKFLEDKKDAVIFHPARVGIFIMKRPPEG